LAQCDFFVRNIKPLLKAYMALTLTNMCALDTNTGQTHEHTYTYKLHIHTCVHNKHTHTHNKHTHTHTGLVTEEQAAEIVDGLIAMQHHVKTQDQAYRFDDLLFAYSEMAGKSTNVCVRMQVCACVYICTGIRLIREITCFCVYCNGTC
jgi:hypothetical protein